MLLVPISLFKSCYQRGPESSHGPEGKSGD